MNKADVIDFRTEIPCHVHGLDHSIFVCTSIMTKVHSIITNLTYNISLQVPQSFLSTNFDTEIAVSFYNISLCFVSFFFPHISVNFQHSQTSVTPLMVAAAKGNTDTVEKLLTLGANVHLKAGGDQ